MWCFPIPVLFPFYSVQQIEASVSSQQFGSPHEHANEGQSVVDTEPLPVSENIILPSQLTRRESSSSESTTSETDHDQGKGLGRHDSFYESDEDLSFSTPRKPEADKNEKKVKAVKRPVPVPRKQDSLASATSYENEEAIVSYKAQESMEKMLRDEQYAIAVAAVAKQQEFEEEQRRNMLDLDKVDNEPLQLETSTSYDYENTPTSMTDAKSSYDSQRPSSPELYDYENSNLGQLPSYEEAVAGEHQGQQDGAEFFNLDELEAPPVPLREDSHIMSGSPTLDYATNNTLSDISSEEVRIERKLPQFARLLYLVSSHKSHMGLVARKPVFGVSDKTRLRPISSATETS